MTGNKDLFSSIQFKEGGTVTFGDNNKGQVVGIGTVGINFKTLINSVLLVDGLKYNLLNISQLCDKNYKIVFENDMTILLFNGFRKKNIYINKILGLNQKFYINYFIIYYLPFYSPFC